MIEKIYKCYFAIDTKLLFKEFLYLHTKSVNAYCQLQEGDKIIGSQNLHIHTNDT